MSNIVERVYGAGITAADVERLKPGYVVVEGVRPPAEVDGMKTAVADLERATRNCALHRVVATTTPTPGFWPIGWRPEGDSYWPADAVFVAGGDIVRVRHEQLEQLDVSEQGLCAINAQHILAVVKSEAP